MSQQFVKRRLKTPATAEFPSIVWDEGSVTVEAVGPQEYVVRSYVRWDRSAGLGRSRLHTGGHTASRTLPTQGPPDRWEFTKGPASGPLDLGLEPKREVLTEQPSPDRR